MFTKLSFSGFNPDLIACHIILTRNINNNLPNRNIIVFSTHLHNMYELVTTHGLRIFCENYRIDEKSRGPTTNFAMKSTTQYYD